MRDMLIRMCVLGIPSLLVACVTTEDDPEIAKRSDPLVITPAMGVTDEGRLEFDAKVFAETNTTLLEKGDFHGYNFRGKAGSTITISQSAANAETQAGCDKLDPFLFLFLPATNGDRGADIARNDDAGLAPCSTSAKISAFTLPVDGDYLIIATSFLQEGGGNYNLELTCNSGDCAQAGQITFPSSRLAQTDIDNGVHTPTTLFGNGFFLFKRIYRLQDGLGNALIGGVAGNNPRPNCRKVHSGAFGAACEAASCATCHQQGGVDGAGDLNHNIFQIGDGVDPNTGVERNSPVVLGLGYRQAIGAEMTTEIKAQLAAGKAQATAQNAAVTVALASKGTSFGSVIAKPDNTVDFTNLRGIDTDLVVKPFGWKNRESLLRRFIEGGFRVHFGMQTVPQVLKHCQTPNPAVLGNGPNCLDPDNDGVFDEITEGQLSSISIYLGLRQVPVRVPHTNPVEQQKAVEGESLFAQVGCAGCHTPTMTLDAPQFREPADTTGGNGVLLNFAVDTRTPRPTINANGSMTVELWSDFKRHDMGADLADSKPFNQIAANQFGTTPLWGVATSAPYLHDGRAPTLHDAIVQHGGEGLASRNAYLALSVANQQKVVAFLNTLSRAEFLAPPPPTVDVSNFTLTQANSTLTFKLPAGTVVQKGNFVIVGRNATKEQFEAFYYVTLPPNTIYINSANLFPAINGAETFSLKNVAGTVIDGPTTPQPASGLRILQRISGAGAASDAANWVSKAADIANASPGTGAASTGQNRIYISEVADTAGAGNFNFEYVELFVE